MSAASTPKLPPTPMNRAPRPELGTDLITKDRYIAPSFAAREWERMWARTWILAGLECDVPEPGDYFTFEIGTESVLVIRQHSGEVVARYNACRHRGTRLREPGLGHVRSFTCRFHAWRYGIDGSLERAQDGPRVILPGPIPRDKSQRENRVLGLARIPFKGSRVAYIDGETAAGQASPSSSPVKRILGEDG